MTTLHRLPRLPRRLAAFTVHRAVSAPAILLQRSSFVFLSPSSSSFFLSSFFHTSSLIFYLHSTPSFFHPPRVVLLSVCSACGCVISPLTAASS
jgi:hypothetical protein